MGDFLTNGESVLAFDDVQIRDVDVPEWGGTVRMRSLPSKERDAYEATTLTQRGDQLVPDLTNYRAKLVARSAINPDTGQRLWTDAQIAKLGEKNSAVLNRLYEVAREISGMSPEEEEKLAGNSGAAPSGDSGSSSPES